jgi:hypothetical protein
MRSLIVLCLAGSASFAAGKTVSKTNIVGYTFHQGLDSWNGDIKIITGQTPQELAQWCSENTNCLGFNTNGWVKQNLLPKGQWTQWTSETTEGFYVKNEIDTSVGQPASANIDGYIFHQGLDSDSGDIKVITGQNRQTPQQLAQFCSENTNCLGFNTNGWVKQNLLPKSQWTQWTSETTEGFYVKNEIDTSVAQPASANIEGYTFHQGLDSDSGDIKLLNAQTPQQLAQFCSENTNCLGFNTNGWVKQNLLPKIDWTQWTSEPTEGFYVKNEIDTSVAQPASANIKGYTFYQGLDSDSGDIKLMNEQTPQELAQFCSETINCVGFNTNGWVKQNLLPRIEWTQWTSEPTQGFYVKN